jgi:glycosyltransferase involved in cell wall biosynthesis
MRVGYLTYGLDRKPTGIGRYALELLRALAALPDGPELVLLTTERDDPHQLWERFERHPLPGCRLLPALLTLGNARLSAAAQRHGLDLIHDPNGIAPFLWPVRPAPLVATVHDAFAYVYPETQARLDVWRCRALLPAALRRAAAVITDSEHSRRDLAHHLRLPPDSIAVAPLAAGACFAPVSDSCQRAAVLEAHQIEQPYLLYTGGINPRKNIIALLKAFALLCPSHPQLQLVIVGKPQWRATPLEAASQQLGIAERIRLVGYVADADLPTLYRAASCFVFPSLYEGFGLPPLEALACGTPVVCSNSSSLPEVVGDAALLVEPHDISGLARAIERVLDEPELAAELRARGLRRAAGFSWERTARITVEIYQAALRRAGQKAGTNAS